MLMTAFFISCEEKHIDSIIESLRNPSKDLKNVDSMLLDKEEDYAGFLGIDLHQNEDGTIKLLQTGLIDKIVNALNLDQDTTIKSTPTLDKPLLKDKDGAPRKEEWNYASIIGMLLYLASNSRPDIAFAVNQCACYSTCTKLSHEQAIKRIAKYLLGTKTRGLKINPSATLKLDLYADADFAGQWNVEFADNPASVKSRSGSIITLGDIPVLWSSKLQTQIATSTMHAEYIALSNALQDLIPIQDLLKEINEKFMLKRIEDTKLLRFGKTMKELSSWLTRIFLILLQIVNIMVSNIIGFGRKEKN